VLEGGTVVDPSAGLDGRHDIAIEGGKMRNAIETRMPVAFTKFVVQRKMPLTRFVDIISANAARILGLYPQKGAIQPAATRTSC
jgi:dihydroorotase-like cyclic amidohydrolase